MSTPLRALAYAVPARGNSPTVSDRLEERKNFHRWRDTELSRLDVARAAWNDAVAHAVEVVGKQEGLSTVEMGEEWHETVAAALRALKRPLHSDVILSVREPFLWNQRLVGRMRAYGTALLSEDPEFMPSTDYSWPRFPYFRVEPGTAASLWAEGLALLANPPAATEDEDDVVGASLCRSTYGRTPMVSLDLELQPLPEGQSGALLLNWSCRGRLGAMAKIFIDGQLDVPAFEVVSSDDDPTPNFWTVIPWREGSMVVDLKHVGSGYLLFEHCDVHHVIW